MKYSYFGKNIPEKKIEKWVYDDVDPDIVFSFGGDGTMLRAFHQYINKIEKIKFVGIKEGSLGFFYSFNNDALDKIIEKINNKTINFNNYNLLQYKIIGEEVICGYALNDMTIINPIHTQIIDVYINNKLFENFRGTGFIISPPAGSTAYSRSLGGSIVDPEIESFQLVEIASINNRLYKTISSPLIFGKKSSLKLCFGESQNIYLCVDGIEVKCLGLKEMEFSLSNRSVCIISDGEDFFTRVKKSFLSEK